MLVSGSLEVPWDARFFQQPEAPAIIVATLERAPADPGDALAGNVEVWRMGDPTVDVAVLCHRLKARGVERLLVEGGGSINWDFMRNDLFDELFLTVASAVLGGERAPTWMAGTGFAMKEQRRLKLLQAQVHGDEIFCHYRVLSR